MGHNRANVQEVDSREVTDNTDGQHQGFMQPDF